MSCITTGNTRCTKCCEAIHIPANKWIGFRKGQFGLGESSSIGKYWKPISKRVAKKINPYIFNKDDNKKYLKTAKFFTCTALSKGEGCTIREQDDHPKVCKIFEGDTSYSPTCSFDINIIARG